MEKKKAISVTGPEMGIEMAKAEEMGSFPVGPPLFSFLLIRWSQMDIMRCTCSRCGWVSSPQAQVLFPWHRVGH